MDFDSYKYVHRDIPLFQFGLFVCVYFDEGNNKWKLVSIPTSQFFSLKILTPTPKFGINTNLKIHKKNKKLYTTTQHWVRYFAFDCPLNLLEVIFSFVR